MIKIRSHNYCRQFRHAAQYAAEPLLRLTNLRIHLTALSYPCPESECRKYLDHFKQGILARVCAIRYCALSALICKALQKAGLI